MQLHAKKPVPKAYPASLKTIGDHIRKRRINLKLTQKQVAQTIGVDEATVWNWERDKTKPLTKQIPAIMLFLGYSPFKSSAASLAERLIHYRMSHALSQKKLARLIGIDPATLSRMEENTGRQFGSIIKKVSDFISAQPPDEEMVT